MLTVYVDHDRPAMPLPEALEALSDDFINSGRNCPQNLIDLRDVCEELLYRTQGPKHVYLLGREINGEYRVCSAYLHNEDAEDELRYQKQQDKHVDWMIQCVELIDRDRSP